MTSFAIASPAAVANIVPPVGAPPVPPPLAPTPPTRTPLTGISTTLVTDLTEASRLVSKGQELLGTLPFDDPGSEATKDLRIRIFKTSEAAQKRIEKQFAGNPESVVSELRRADAYLEDANWQLARKPSPDGRFNGVDIPGAVRDTAEGARILNELLAAAGGSPSSPAIPPPDGPVGPPPVTPPGRPPVTPPLPPEQPPVPQPDGPGGTNPPAPPAPPNGGGTPDPDYPGEDEFPTDEKILNGSGSSSGDS